MTVGLVSATFQETRETHLILFSTPRLRDLQSFFPRRSRCPYHLWYLAFSILQLAAVQYISAMWRRNARAGSMHLHYELI
jgi:hypothetical protein